MTGWWLTYPSEKWCGLLFPTYGKIIQPCSKPPTSMSSVVIHPQPEPRKISGPADRTGFSSNCWEKELESHWISKIIPLIQWV